MKRNKGIYKGAIVLFIAMFMVISTLPAMADTDENPYVEKRIDAIFTADGPTLTNDPYTPTVAPHPYKTGGKEFEKFDSTFGDRSVIISEGFEDLWQPDGSYLALDDAPFDATYGAWEEDGIAVGLSSSGQLAQYWYRDIDIVGWGTPNSGIACAGVYWSSTEAQDEWLMTPIMDLEGYSDIVLTFYGVWNWADAQADHEYVKVSTDGGSTWTILADLLTDPMYEVGVGGIAGAGWCWNEYQVVLALPDGTDQYQVAWNLVGSPGMNPVTFIDDVELSGIYTPPGGCDFEVVSINLDDEVNSEAKNIEVTIRNNGPEPILEVKKLVSIEQEIPGVTSEIYNEGFEGSLADWMVTDNGDMDSFTLSTTRVHAGNYSMRCTAGIDRPDAVQDTYLGHAHDSGPDELIMVSPIDFTGAVNGEISFWHYCNGEYYVDGDGYVVPTDFGTIAIDWGLGFATLPFSMFVAYDNGWEQVTIDLGAIGIPMTSSIAIKFMWDSDPHMEYEGWYIDDVTFSRTEPPSYQLVDQMWSIQALDGFEEREEIFELPWENMIECNIYKICVLGQVFDPIDCENNLDNNELCIFVHIYDCEDAAVNWVTGPDRIEKCTNGTFIAEIENTGTYPLVDEEVTLSVSRLIESELFFDNFESGVGNWDRWSWGTPGVVPHATDFDAYSGTTSMAFFDDSAAGYPNVVDLMDARALCNYVFDFSSDSNRGAFLSFYANWANLAGDEWRVMIYDPISNYVLGWYGNSGVNGDFYGPSNPDGFPEMYTFDLKEQMDYWYGAYGATYGMFANPDGSIHYECGIGFYLEADDDGCVYVPGQLWSGLMIDDVRVYERYCDSTQIEVDTATIDFLDLGDTTLVEFEWHGEQYCNWCVCASVDDD